MFENCETVDTIAVEMNRRERINKHLINKHLTDDRKHVRLVGCNHVLEMLLVAGNFIFQE